jgi:hypothetical protein
LGIRYALEEIQTLIFQTVQAGRYGNTYSKFTIIDLASGMDDGCWTELHQGTNAFVVLDQDAEKPG